MARVRTMSRTTSSLLLSRTRGSFDRFVFESEHSNGGGSSDRSVLFRLCQLVVIIMRCVTPVSYIYLLILGLRLLLYKDDEISYSFFGGKFSFILITLWMTLEAVFFPYYYLMFRRLNKINHDLEHFASDQATRVRLVTNCFQAMRAAACPGSAMTIDPELYLRKVIEGWFLDIPIAQIYHGNFAQWTSWAFFGKEWTTLNAQEVEQNNALIAYIEKEVNWSFPPGFAKDMPSARLTIDPVFATQRPLYFYATIAALNSSAHLALYMLGFVRKKEYDTSAQSIYHRPARKSSSTPSLLSSSASANVPYTNINAAKPIVFVHGIGIGFAHYMGLIMSFSKDVDVFLVEWPYVAMQMSDRAPTIEESVRTITKMLDDNNHSQACFVAHSLGTTAVSWMLHDTAGCKRVHSSVLLDPVTFLLCDPTVATSFVYKDPTTTINFLMHFFLSRELFIANALSRHFQWSHNIMFVEDLAAVGQTDSTPTSIATPPSPAMQMKLRSGPFTSEQLNYGSTDKPSKRTSKSVKSDKPNSSNSSSDSDDAYAPQPLAHTIILSDHDLIVPVDAVNRYLMTKQREGNTCFEVINFHGTHGEMFLYPKWVALISDKIKERCGGDGK